MRVQKGLKYSKFARMKTTKQNYESREGSSDFRLPTSDFRLSTSVAIKGGGRPTPLLPHAKMLLVSIKFFPSAGYIMLWKVLHFLLSKCDFSRLFHTERSWHMSIYSGFCFWLARFAP